MSNRQPVRVGLVQLVQTLLILIPFVIIPAAVAATVGVIGTGRVGSALGPRLAEHGYTVVYGSRDPSQAKVQELVARTGEGADATTPKQAAQRAEFVLLAVPWRATEEVLKSLGSLKGKILIDATNPLSLTNWFSR